MSADSTKGDRIPIVQKLAFSAGCGFDFLATGLTMGAFWMPYFNIGLGIRPAVLGMILMIIRGIDAFMDPVMGNISDNARTPWGRRRPFMVIGAVCTSIVYPLLWRLPSNPDSIETVIYLVAIGTLLSAFFTCWAMPYYGMQLELTPSYDERTRLTAWMALFGKLFGLLGAWSLAVLAGPWFADTVTKKPNIVHGMLTCSWYIAVFIIIFGLLPPLFVRERYYEAEASHQARDPFWKGIGESIRCGPLWSLMWISFFLSMGSSSVGILGGYLNIYLVNGGKMEEAGILNGWKGTILTGVGILGIPCWTWLGEKLDKKTAVCIMLPCSMMGHLLNLCCLRPDYPYLQLVPTIFESAAITAIWLFIPSMKGDVADYDELATARRREGSLNSFFSWFLKVSLTCSMGIGGVLLELSGFNVKSSIQSPEVLHRMLLLFVFLPITMWGCAWALIWRYPLNRERMFEIRQELENRRGKL